MILLSPQEEPGGRRPLGTSDAPAERTNVVAFRRNGRPGAQLHPWALRPLTTPDVAVVRETSQ
jgi:hypothetical protein